MGHLLSVTSTLDTGKYCRRGELHTTLQNKITRRDDIGLLNAAKSLQMQLKG